MIILRGKVLGANLGIDRIQKILSKEASVSDSLEPLFLQRSA